MEKKTYHHGDLRRTLIQTGLELITRDGLSKLSLRKVAAKCGVSHNAPYMHFADKGDFISAICDYIDISFTGFLEDIFEKNKGNPRDCMGKAGIGYVTFMVNNPDYFNFMFTGGMHKTHSSSRFSGSLSAFRKISEQYLKTTNIKQEEYEITMLAMWGMVQGLASLFVSGSVPLMDNYEAVVGQVLAEKMRV